ncbi:uncharacterized protein PFL1_03886 [Pseudozyma flocculosa PF-1]|uniref:Uncharacterized protein n=1 Tax=Pseudozyma flocculosa PF-1 TaxID=1277687 RepID=A0A061H6T0_9BASI|nr:uncharacterized protein PFL1_03886 [Pseudozyma flocculosa PF-1]EPQ28582.1 hypothetical protein PFL1_03886 [Pseudozyma flocculosa PF-1]
MKITGTFMILAASMASAVSGLAHHANVDGNGAIYICPPERTASRRCSGSKGSTGKGALGAASAAPRKDARCWGITVTWGEFHAGKPQ